MFGLFKNTPEDPQEKLDREFKEKEQVLFVISKIKENIGVLEGQACIDFHGRLYCYEGVYSVSNKKIRFQRKLAKHIGTDLVNGEDFKIDAEELIEGEMRKIKSDRIRWVLLEKDIKLFKLL